MTKDEWVKRGLLFASRAEEEPDLDQQEKWFQKSLGPFMQSGSEPMKTRVQQQLRSLSIRRNIMAHLDPASGLSGAHMKESEIAGLVQSLVENGLAEEATRLCQSSIHAIDEEAQEQLVSQRVLGKLPKLEVQ